MNHTSYSAMLRELSKDYYQNHIGFEEYRSRRKAILDKIDLEFNGQKSYDPESGEVHEASILMKTIAFFKNRDLE